MTITFITGANKGIGRETARRLIACGHTVLLGARDRERGEEAAAALGARFVPVDVTDEASVAAAAADVAEHEGRIDVLINNAGVRVPSVIPATSPPPTPAPSSTSTSSAWSAPPPRSCRCCAVRTTP